MSRRRARAVIAALGVLVLLLAGVFVVHQLAPKTPPLTPAQRAAIAARRAAARLLKLETHHVRAAEQLVSVALPTSWHDPAPTTPPSLFAAPLPRHEVVSFVPYYQMNFLVPADLTESSVLVYSSLCIGNDGALSTSGVDCSNGWDTLHSSLFGDLVANSHAAGDRVLVSVSSFVDSDIKKLLADPVASASRLAAGIEPIVAADHLDGVNIDVEGSSPSNANRFVTFVRTLTSALRAADPGGEIVLDAFAASASGSRSFFRIGTLAKLVDRVFVEAYQMDDPTQSSANAPIASASLGYSVVQSLIQYEKVVPADKLILGVPFYGLDFTTAGPDPGSTTTTAGPIQVTYAAIMDAAHPARWDPAAESPYADFTRDGSVHQIWYDDPLSIALKVALASSMGTAGVGAWALGMENGSSEMLDALTGGAPPLKLPLAG